MTNITQEAAAKFASAHIHGRANWMIAAIFDALSGEGPEWSPIDEDRATCAVDALREVNAALEHPVLPHIVALARARLSAADIQTSYCGSVDDARELAESVGEVIEQMMADRDAIDETTDEYHALDRAADLLGDYASQLETDNPDEREVMQAFMVSEWLARFLDRAGEATIRDDDQNHYWLRTCCGQACHLDTVIEDAAAKWYDDDHSRTVYALDKLGHSLLIAARIAQTPEGLTALQAVVAQIDALKVGA